MKKLITILFAIWATVSFSGPRCDEAASFWKDNKAAIEEALGGDKAILEQKLIKARPTMPKENAPSLAIFLLYNIKSYLTGFHAALERPDTTATEISRESDCRFSLTLLKGAWSSYLEAVGEK